MRRKSKGEILREKIKEALVPADECPYEVPENWCWTYLGEVVEIKRGASPRPIKEYITDDENGTNWIKIGDADGTKYISCIKEKITEEGVKKSVFVKKGTLLLSNSMSFGHPYILNVDGCIHDGWLALKPSEYFDKEYLYYSLLSSDWYFEKVAVGTAVRNLNSDRVARTPMPLPPLAEQERIVDRVESLFEKLDEAKEKVQQVLDESENRRSAILHKAFTGELTSKWREENNIEYRVQNVPFEECIKSMQNGLSKRNGNEGENIPVLRLANFGDTEIIENNIRPIKLTEEEKEKYILHANDILMVRVNGSRDNVGKVYNVNSDNSYAYCDHIIRIVLNDKIIDNSYYIYFTYTKEYREYIGKHMVSSAGQNTISRKGLKDLYIPICTLNEQQKIVTMLDDLLQKEYQIFDFNTEIINKIDNIKKSILAKAFRGELGTNNPSDGNAIFLLKNILEEERGGE